ncbi:unnamed protein product [Urochloa humidicola]
MDGAVPAIAVLALGAGALGGPDALRLLMELAGRNRNPAFDIGIVVFLISMFAAQLLGTLLLARYVRKAPPAGGVGGRGAPAADPFACITLLLSLAAASLVTACLVLVSGGFAAAAAGAALLYATPLLRMFREQRNARGRAARAQRATAINHAARISAAAAAAGAALPCIALLLRAFRQHRNARGRAARPERGPTTHQAPRFIGAAPLAAAAAVCALAAAAHSGARRGLDALRPSPPGLTNMAVAVAAAAVVGAALLVLLVRRARNAAAVGGGVAAPAPAAAPARSLAVFSQVSLLVFVKDTPPQREGPRPGWLEAEACSHARSDR